jgi:L-ribulose-5-phosphate 3-epimerase
MSLVKKIGIMQGRLSPIINKRIQSFPLMNWKKEFSILKKIGIKNIEWTLDYDSFEKNPVLSNIGIKEIKSLSKKHKIKINSLTGDCFMEKPFWKLKKNIDLIEDFKKVVNSCNQLKIKYIVIPLVDNGSLKNKKDEKKLKKILFNLIKFIKKNKVEILFESDYGPKKLGDFIKKFDKKLFGINYDTGNSASLGYNINDEFENYGKFIKNVHIKDRIFKGSTIKLGNGNVNFSDLFKNLKRIRYKNFLILQTARSKSGNHVLEIKNNIKFLKNFSK